MDIRSFFKKPGGGGGGGGGAGATEKKKKKKGKGAWWKLWVGASRWHCLASHLPRLLYAAHTEEKAAAAADSSVASPGEGGKAGRKQCVLICLDDR